MRTCVFPHRLTPCMPCMRCSVLSMASSASVTRRIERTPGSCPTASATSLTTTSPSSGPCRMWSRQTYSTSEGRAGRHAMVPCMRNSSDSHASTNVKCHHLCPFASGPTWPRRTQSSRSLSIYLRSSSGRMKVRDSWASGPPHNSPWHALLTPHPAASSLCRVFPCHH